MGEVISLRERHHMERWPIIGFWKAEHPIIGECGYMPVNWQPWCSYVVLPQPKEDEPCR